MEIVIDGTAFDTCTFTTSTRGTDIGQLIGTKVTGGSAILNIHGSMGSACGAGTWEGFYTVTNPLNLMLEVD